MINNPSTPVITDLTKKMQNGNKSSTTGDAAQGSNSSRKRKAPESNAAEELETTITLDTLEASILKRAAEPLVMDDTLRQAKRIHKPAFDNTTPCQGCGRVGVKIWRVGPNGNATLCDKCGDKMKDGTLGKVVAPSGTPSRITAVAPTPNEGHVAPPPTGHTPSLASGVPDKTQPDPSTFMDSALARESPPHLAHGKFVPSVLQPGSRAGSGPESRWSPHDHRTSDASTSITPSHPHRSSQTLLSGINGDHRVQTHGPAMQHAFGPANSGSSSSTSKSPNSMVMTPQARPPPSSAAPSSATQHAIGPANSGPSRSTLQVSEARDISPQIASFRPAVVPYPVGQHVSGPFNGAASNSAPRVLTPPGISSQYRPHLPFTAPSPATQHVPGTADSRPSDLGVQLPKSANMTPQVGPPLHPAAPSPGLETTAGSPGHLYHEPRTISGYIAPRKILPSTIVQAPSVGFRQSPQSLQGSQPGSPRATAIMSTPVNAPANIPPADFRPVQAPRASTTASSIVGLIAPSIRPPGSPAATKPQVSSVSATALSGLAEPNPGANNGASPLLALAVAASEASLPALNGRPNVAQISDPLTSIPQ